MKIRTDPTAHGLPSPPSDSGMAEEGLRNSIGVRVGQLFVHALLLGGDTPIGAKPSRDRKEQLRSEGRLLAARFAAAGAYARQYEIETDDEAIVAGLYYFLDGVREELARRLIKAKPKKSVAKGGRR